MCKNNFSSLTIDNLALRLCIEENKWDELYCNPSFLCWGDFKIIGKTITLPTRGRNHSKLSDSVALSCVQETEAAGNCGAETQNG